MDLVERLRKLYSVKKNGNNFTICLNGKPVGVYKKDGTLVRVMDYLNLPLQECVPMLLMLK